MTVSHLSDKQLQADLIRNRELLTRPICKGSKMRVSQHIEAIRTEMAARAAAAYRKRFSPLTDALSELKDSVA